MYKYKILRYQLEESHWTRLGPMKRLTGEIVKLHPQRVRDTKILLLLRGYFLQKKYRVVRVVGENVAALSADIDGTK